MTTPDPASIQPIRFFMPVISYVYEYEDGGPRAEMVETDHCNGLYYFRGDVDARLTAETRRREEAEASRNAAWKQHDEATKGGIDYWTWRTRQSESERDAAIARAGKAEKERDEAKEALVGMCYQYLSVRNGKLHHDFMSAGEHAFDVLGWPDTGHPVAKGCLCEVEGCGERWDAGWKDSAGTYHTTCGEHYRAALAVTPTTTTTTETKKEGEG